MSNDSRKLFEKAMRAQGMGHLLDRCEPAFDGVDRGYKSAGMQHRWIGWQAARSYDTVQIAAALKHALENIHTSSTSLLNDLAKLADSWYNLETDFSAYKGCAEQLRKVIADAAKAKK